MITSENRTLLLSNTRDIVRPTFEQLKIDQNPRQLILTLEALGIKIAIGKSAPEISLKRLLYTTDRVRMNLKKVY